MLFEELEFEKHGLLETIGTVGDCLDYADFLPQLHARITFDNGYTASVVKYKRSNVPFEIAILRGGETDYSTPFCNEVVNYIDEFEVERILMEISMLPPK